jgi:micrococcal nuclease
MKYKYILSLCVVIALTQPLQSAETWSGPVSATVIWVYDGDTVIVDARPWPQITMRVSVRVNGIDTPELRGKCGVEKEQAKRAKERTTDLVGAEVTLSDIFLGKYAGRVVANVHTQEGTDIAQALISEGLARAYDGGTRQGWCSS